MALRVSKLAFLPMPLSDEHRAALDVVQLAENMAAECLRIAREVMADFLQEVGIQREAMERQGENHEIREAMRFSHES